MNLGRALEIFEELSALDESLRAERIAVLSDTERAEATYAGKLLDFDLATRDGQATGNTQPASLPRVDVTRFGNYELKERLGHGAHGVVWKARKLGSDKFVALKVLQRPADQNGWNSFEPEVRSAPKLRHPNIVWVVDSGECDGQPYLEMELIDGHPLHEYAVSRSLEAIQIAMLMRPIVGAVAFAHQQGPVIHRDIKPQNILVDRGGSPYLTDFGIAKLVGDQCSKTVDGMIQGTPAYMSPEQANGSASVGPATDVYSLGAVLYFLLTNRAPFVAADQQAIMRKVISDAPLQPRKLNPNADRDLETICLKCLNKKPKHRYVSAHELSDELARFVSGRPIKARRPTMAEHGMRWVQRYPLYSVLWAAVLVFGVLASVMGFQRSQQRAVLTGRFREKLIQAGEYRGSREWQRALAAAEQAETLADQPLSIDRQLRSEVQNVRRDVEMAIKLAALRERVSVVDLGGDGKPVSPEAVAQKAKEESDRYHKAFAEYGIDLRNLEPDEVYQRFRNSAIRVELVKALDNWSMLEAIPGARVALLMIAQKADPDEFRKQIRAAILTQDPQEIVELLRNEDLDQFPPESLEFAAMGLARKNRLDDAIDLMQRAVLHHSGDPWLNFSLGSLYVMAGRPGEALTYRRISVVFRPQSAELHLNLGAVLYDLRRFEEALAEFERSVQLKPNYVPAWENVGSALQQLGRFEKARDAYRKAIDLDASRGSAQAGLGFLYLNDLGDPELAGQSFRTAMELGHDSADLRVGLGMSLERQGRLDEAASEFQQALKLDSDKAMAHQRWGVVLAKQQQYAKSRVKLERALELDPSDADAHYSFALTCYELNDQEAAIRGFKRAAELNPTNERAHFNLAVLYRDNHQRELAIEAFSAAVAAKPEWADAHYQLAVEVAKDGRQREAVESMKRAAELQPNDAQMQFSLGALLFDGQSFEEARKVLENCLRLDPDHPLGNAYLGMTYRKLTEFKLAETTLRKAIRLVPSPLGEELRLQTAVEQVARLAAIEGRLSEIVQRQLEPESDLQRLDFADLCYRKKFFAGAALYFEDALTGSPQLAENPSSGHRYNAACCAALAGCGQGADAEQLTEEKRAYWRSQSLAWLTAEKTSISESKDLDRQRRRLMLGQWLRDPDLAGVRDSDRLDMLPPDEQESWRGFWSEVRAELEP